MKNRKLKKGNKNSWIDKRTKKVIEQIFNSVIIKNIEKNDNVIRKSIKHFNTYKICIYLCLFSDGQTDGQTDEQILIESDGSSIKKSQKI